MKLNGGRGGGLVYMHGYFLEQCVNYWGRILTMSVKSSS